MKVWGTNGAALRRAGLVGLASLSLAGCISFGGKAPAQMYGLTAERSAPAGDIAAGKAGEALIVAEPETDRRLAVLRIAVQVDAAQVAYLKDAQWVERPARLFGALLAETLRAGGKRLVLAEREALVPGGSRLTGRLLDMGYDARRQAAVVRYDAILTARDGTVTTRRFESVVGGVEPKAQAVGPALNEAANDVAGQVAEWVG